MFNYCKYLPEQDPLILNLTAKVHGFNYFEIINLKINVF